MPSILGGMSQHSTNAFSANGGDGERFLSKAQVRHRYGDCSVMTVHRWVEAGILPSPVYFGRRPFWALSQLQAREATLPTARVKVGQPAAGLPPLAERDAEA